jgi:hypothetical protein
MVGAAPADRATAGAQKTAGPGRINFARDIEPIISDKCYFCHGPDANHRKADLRWDLLDPKEGPFAPRDGYSIVVPGKPDDSVVMMRITADDADVKMPPPDSHRTLDADQIELIKRWIEQGAKWARHWSLEPPVRAPIPVVKDRAWPRNAIDSFVLARLERDGLEPSPEAPKRTLIRRVTLDLTGLPPTPEEVNAFLEDSSPDAYEKVVDRLLASPRYGEQMAWAWLDLARYADTNGYQNDPTRTMWPWRDWVIKAFNQNMAYDQFVTWQLAGDLLPHATLDQQIASGFNRNHPYNGEGGRIAEETRVENVLDRTDTIGTAFLGYTVGCAKCHDHKFDPISQKEYYSLFAYFNQCSETGRGKYVNEGNVAPVVDVATPPEQAKLIALRRAEKQAVDRLIAADFAKFNDPFPPRVEPLVGELAAAKKAHQELDSKVVKVMVMDDATPRQTHVLIKSAYDKPGDAVEPGVPAMLNPLPKQGKNDRLKLARWLFDPANPLVARVTVNRMWQRFFGVGIVKTAGDFGVQGERPVDQDLLDWLACEFRDGGWNIKAMDRLIVTSSTYRQSSKQTPQTHERDPENRLCARGPRGRLPSWELRDQALAAGGLLVEKLGGPPVKPYQPPGIWEEATFGTIKYVQDHGDSLYRRSLYTFWRRIVGPAEFFDTSDRTECTVLPSRTNTPLHALTTLNDMTYVEAARSLAQGIMLSAKSPEDRLKMAYERVLCRDPQEQEQSILLTAIARLKRQYAADAPAAQRLLAIGESKRDQRLDPVDHAAWTAICLEILNLDEALNNE